MVENPIISFEAAKALEMRGIITAAFSLGFIDGYDHGVCACPFEKDDFRFQYRMGYDVGVAAYCIDLDTCSMCDAYLGEGGDAFHNCPEMDEEPQSTLCLCGRGECPQCGG